MKRIMTIAALLALLVIIGGTAYAENNPVSKQEVLELNDTIQKKKTELEDLRDRIESYKRIISEKQNQEITLANELALLENRFAKTELDIEAAQTEIAQITAEIDLLDQSIIADTERINRQRELIAALLREIQVYDRRTPLEVMLGSTTFSEFYSHLHFLEDIQNRLQETLDEVESLKAEREAQKEEQQRRLVAVAALRETLEEKKLQLQQEQSAKEFLFASTQATEAKFQDLLRSLREESQFVDVQLGALQGKLTSRLKELDVDFNGDAIFSWPLTNVSRISARFHDPNYPFRHLFEHSGLDMPTPTGTAVNASAPGIVAAARTGKLYGNYVMLVHPNGYATLYAHLSQILVRPDEVVDRGEIIALSGGARGAAGSGLSTGPHLHFEVRVDGVPTDPFDYLVSF